MLCQPLGVQVAWSVLAQGPGSACSGEQVWAGVIGDHRKSVLAGDPVR